MSPSDTPDVPEVPDTPEVPARSLDEVLAGVVAAGTRRRTQRRIRSAGAAALALVLFAGVAAVAMPTGQGEREVAAPVTTTTAAAASEPQAAVTDTTLPATTTTTAPPPPKALVKTTTPEAFLARVKREALGEVTAYGLPARATTFGGGRPTGVAVRTVTQPTVVASPSAGGAPSGTTSGGSAPSSGSSGGQSNGDQVAAAPTAGSAPPPQQAKGDTLGVGEGGGTATRSGTNNQEVGVDEPDVVKLTGDLLVRARYDRLSIAKIGPPPVVLSDTALGGSTRDLLVVGTRLVAFVQPNGGSGGGSTTDGVSSSSGIAPNRSSIEAVVVDIANPKAPKVVARHRIEGSLVSAREIGGTVVLAVADAPDITFAYPTADTPAAQKVALAENKRRIQASSTKDWLDPSSGCTDAFHTADDTGLVAVSVRALDPAGASLGPATCVISAADVLYASATRLYVATSAAELAADGNAAVPETTIHRFDLPTTPANAPTYVATGTVPGTVLSQYSISELGDDLRVATTRSRPGPNGTTSTDAQVSVLRPSGRTLAAVGILRGLGPNEHITGVRFFGTVGFVVTAADAAPPTGFCDPLFVIDLTSAEKPKLRGDLEIPGITSYLHAGPSGRLLGVGVDVPEGQQSRCGRSAPQVSLFDIRDLDNPKMLSRKRFDLGSSAATSDPHAFLWWAPTRTIVIPLSTGEFIGAVVLTVGDDGVVERGRIEHRVADGSGSTYPVQIDRAYVVDGSIVTSGDGGIRVTDLTTLKDKGFAGYPTGNLDYARPSPAGTP